MKRTRMSLKDIIKEDSKGVVEVQAEKHDEKDEETVPAPPPQAAAGKINKEKGNTIKDKTYNISEKAISKSEFVKMSITVEPDLFEMIDDMSRKRRRLKQKYTYSDIARDAFKEYFRNNK